MPEPTRPVLSRRDVLQKSIALGAVFLASSHSLDAMVNAFQEREKQLRKPTPPNVLGPFYKKGSPQNTMLRSPGDPGMPLSVSGQIFDTRGDTLPGATVEVWQTNHLGHYDLAGFHYRAKLLADGEGDYKFDSVIPGHYPDRVCQHVHYAVTAPGHKPLVTQLYFATDPVFEGDPDHNYTRDPLIGSRELVRPVTLIGDPQDIQAAVRFELCLERL